MTARSLPKITAFTFAELLTILALLAVLAGLVLPAIARSQTQTSVTQCAANLEQVLLATQMYATDNNNKLPQITSGNWPWDLPGRTEYSLNNTAPGARNFTIRASHSRTLINCGITRWFTVQRACP